MKAEKRYRVEWTEYHMIEVEALSEDAAYDEAHNLAGQKNTLQDCGDTAIEELPR